MRKIFLLFLFISGSLSLFAQPVYDDCPAYNVGVAPFCNPSVFFTNVDATASDIGAKNIPNCFSDGDVNRDVWISFVASDTILDYVITVTGLKDGTTQAMKYPEIALYRGDCGVDELALVLCAGYNPAVSDTSVTLTATGLTPGATYFMRIHDNKKGDNTVHSGTFVLCIKEKDPVISITEGFSNACSGKIVDSGGETGNYKSNENYFFKICPSGKPSCIVLTLDYYNIDNAGDALTFYDGDNTASPVIDVLSSNNQTGGGAVAYKVKATSGCLSIGFKSDASLNLDGFSGSWQCSIAPCPPDEVIIVIPDVTKEQIIASVSTPATVVTIDTIKCASGAYGSFTATDNSNLGLKKGLLLTTGTVAGAQGPNNSGSTSGFANTPGDSDLDYLSQLQGSQTLSNDACIVELDVFAATDELAFEYVFGSEEYPEFVNSNFNDIFAFFISGPGIVGDPNIKNQKNIAVLPDNTTFVQINSVNNLLNWEYYRNNLGGQTIQYDGLTSDFKGVKTSLSAKSKVTPCNTYHLKFAIADRGDSSWDSGVFISDLKSGTVNFNVTYNSGIDYMIEKCTGEDVVNIKLSNPLDYSVSYKVAVGGTATKGVDYNMTIPNTITFNAGETVLSFPINPIADAITEGVETITITLSNNFGCGDVTYAVLTIELHDAPYAAILNDVDTAFYCKGEKINLSVSGCNTYTWSPAGIMNDPNIANPVASPTDDGYIYVTGEIAGCVAYDSIYLKELNPQVKILPLATDKLCEGKSVKLTATNNTFNQGFSWTPAIGLNSTTNSTVTASPKVTTTYYAQVDLSGCVVKDSVTLLVDPFDFPTVFSDTFKLCQSYPIKLASDIFFSTTTYQWTPAKYLDNPNASGPIATPGEDLLYTLVATSEKGYCVDSAKVYIDVIDAEVNILDQAGIEKDTFYLCKGDSLQLNSTIKPLGSQIKWSSEEGTINNDQAGSVVIKPTYSQWFVSKLTTSECVVYDSVYVQVDSLPLDLGIHPADTTVCQGSIVVLKGNTYEQGHFPNLIFNWEPTFDAKTPDSLYNIVIEANASYTYQRFAYSGACVNISEAKVNVIPTNLLSISPPQATVCPGTTIELKAEAAQPGVTNFEWSPADGLSCTQCQTTIATITGGSKTYQVKGEFMGCPVQASVTINESPLPWVNFPADNIICESESTPLNESPDPTFTYKWTSTDPNFGTSVSSNPVVSPLKTSTYYVTVSNNIGCTAIYQHEIVVAPTPTLTVSADVTICPGEEVTLTATSNAGGNYTWSDGQTGSTIVVKPGGNTIYTVSFEDTYGCGKATASTIVSVDVVPLVSIKATPDSLNVNQGDPVTLEAVTDPPGAIVTYAWKENGNALSQTTKVITVTPLENPTKYTVTVTTPKGCAVSSEIEFNVLPAEWDVPNVFTPNGDGKNDVFKIVLKGKNISISQFSVYNRWGQKIYDKADNNGWNGDVNGKPAPTDTYVYWIVLKTPKGDEVLKGDISLIR